MKPHGAWVAGSVSMSACRQTTKPVCLLKNHINNQPTSLRSAQASCCCSVCEELQPCLHNVIALQVVGQSHSGRGEGSSLSQVLKAFLTEGHTAWDSFLSNASSSVGQVILTYPYQMALMGVIPAIVVAIGVGLLNYYTLWLLIVLYLERKRFMVTRGSWYDTTDSNGYERRSSVTQFHDIIGFFLGRWFGLLAELLTGLYILGVAIAQIVASAGSQYSIDQHYNKLQWGLILGVVILAFGLLPSFRSVRLLNIIALCGTNYSCLYFFIYAAKHGIRPGAFTRGPQSAQGFFLGAAVIGAGGHSIQIEMMDAMRQSRKMTAVSFFSWCWNIVLLLPHSIAIVLAFPNLILSQANVYSILPDSGWKRASVWIMLIHNISAFTLHTNPLLYMWERLIHTHHHPWYIRLPSRIPVLAVIWLLALALPFYGTVNSLFNVLTTGFTAFILPCAAFNWHYRTKERRDNCPVKIPWPLNKWNWKPLFCLNFFLMAFFFSTSAVTGLVYAIEKLISNIHTFHAFAPCYQCPKQKPAHVGL
ncbi:hypothetical protein WJX77_008984 [Trebouxia sp. C0004]